MADKPRPLDDDEIKAIVSAAIRSAVGFLDTDLSQQRADNLKRYLGEPYGNEREGRSQVVSTDVSDTVEWILPSLLKIFTAGDEVVRFEPQGPEDEPVAKQATDYVNWIWSRDNEGFLNFYTWFKDGLISKNGIVKFWWEVKEDWKKESYHGLTTDAFALLMKDVESGEIEIVAHTETQAPGAPVPGPMGELLPGAPEIRHDLVVRKLATTGKACVVPVPPEEFLIGRGDRDIESAKFLGHRVRKTISELREDGHDESILSQITFGEESPGVNTEEMARDLGTDTGASGSGDSAMNDAMREVWVTECYLRVDQDGDGIAERRKITVAGEGSTILDNEEWECMAPFASVCPILMPHRFFGQSVADCIKDLQLIKTTLLRQLLDALYIATNPMMEVEAERIVDPSELMTWRPGGVVRRTGSAPAVTPLNVPFVGAAAIQGMEYIDTIRENRTGVTKYNQGLDANSLNKTATGVSAIMNQAQQRIELIARIYAETGVKRVMRGILELVGKYQQDKRIIRLRNQWVPMDPREWNTEMDVSIAVGLGTGNKEQMAAQLMGLLQIDAQIVQLQGGLDGPLLTGEKLYNTLEKYIENIGLKTAEPYFQDPRNAQPQQPRPDPEVEKAKAQMMIEQEKAKNQIQIDQMKAQASIQLEREKAAAQIEIERMKAQVQAELRQQEMQIKAASGAYAPRPEGMQPG